MFCCHCLFSWNCTGSGCWPQQASNYKQHTTISSCVASTTWKLLTTHFQASHPATATAAATAVHFSPRFRLWKLRSKVAAWVEIFLSKRLQQCFQLLCFRTLHAAATVCCFCCELTAVVLCKNFGQQVCGKLITKSWGQSSFNASNTADVDDELQAVSGVLQSCCAAGSGGVDCCCTLQVVNVAGNKVYKSLRSLCTFHFRVSQQFSTLLLLQRQLRCPRPRPRTRTTPSWFQIFGLICIFFHFLFAI